MVSSRFMCICKSAVLICRLLYLDHLSGSIYVCLLLMFELATVRTHLYLRNAEALSYLLAVSAGSEDAEASISASSEPDTGFRLVSLR